MRRRRKGYPSELPMIGLNPDPPPAYPAAGPDAEPSDSYTPGRALPDGPESAGRPYAQVSVKFLFSWLLKMTVLTVVFFTL